MILNTNIQQPLVSVITPTYNRPKYLTEALKSAVKQTYQNLEIIVSDNCSTENTQAIVESFQDPRIKFWRQPTNIGMFANQMHAFKMAQGKYVASLHDDDIWKEDFLEKLVLPLEANPNLALAFCDHYVMRADSTIDDVATEKNSHFYKRANLKEGIYQPFYQLSLIDRAVSTATAAVIRRDAVDWDSFPPEVGVSWDIYLNYLTCRSGNGAYYYPGKLTCYREHEQTDTMTSGSRDAQAKIRKAKADIFCLERFMEDKRLQDIKPYFEKQWGYISTTLGIGLMRTEQLKDARPYFIRSLRQKFSLRTSVALLLSLSPSKIAAKF
jgi:glycosyltransferase involved in cell wall biosynthesis